MPVHAKTRAEDIREALELKNLSLPARLPVLRLEAEEYTDSTGEPALRILAVLDESVDEEKLCGQDVGDLKFAIRKSLQERGITEFAYIFLAKESELEETDEE